MPNPYYELSTYRAVALGAIALLGTGGESLLSPRSRDVTIVAREYSFTVPAFVMPGLTTFHFVNRGKFTHEVQLFRFNQGTSASAARDWVASGNVPDSVADRSGSVLIAAPGDSVREGLTVRLVSGERYALLCQFRDAPDKPRHTSLGMFGVIEVR